MDGRGCLWKKALSGQGEQGFQEGRGPRFWLLLGELEKEEEKVVTAKKANSIPWYVYIVMLIVAIVAGFFAARRRVLI